MHLQVMKMQKIILWCLSGLVGACLLGLGLTPAHAEPEKKADQKTAPKKLTGAELYAINCNRCHPERYATEFTSAQSSRGAGQGSPEVSPGGQWKLKTRETYQ